MEKPELVALVAATLASGQGLESTPNWKAELEEYAERALFLVNKSYVIVADPPRSEEEGR